MTLVTIDTSSEVSVTDYLTRARDWLSRAVDETGPEQIAAAKAEIATAAEATKQLGLSKEIQLDAQEMVRRAEYALGKAIRKGQAEGTVAKQGHALNPIVHHEDYVPPALPTHFASKGELYGATGVGILTVADAADSDEFEAAIAEAKAEGNLSRANVARKAREKSGHSVPRPATTADDDASLALLNDIRGPWTRGITKSARLMSPKARAHLIDALENALTQIRNI